MPVISQTPTHRVVGKMRLDWKPEILLGCLLTGVTMGKSLHFSETQFPYLLLHSCRREAHNALETGSDCQRERARKQGCRGSLSGCEWEKNAEEWNAARHQVSKLCLFLQLC